MSLFSLRGAKPRSLSPGRAFRTAAILLVVTLAVLSLSSRLFAKYAQNYAYVEQPRVAKAAQVSVQEHRAVLSGGQYTLDMTSVVSGNTYTAVLPGTDIPKDPYVYLDGSQETAYTLYVEIYTNVPAGVSYTVGTNFAVTDELAPSHGGTMYKYTQAVLPAVEQSIGPILRNNVITVSDSFRDKTDPTYNQSGFQFDVYAYVIQID